jgi:hypothetical protein
MPPSWVIEELKKNQEALLVVKEGGEDVKTDCETESEASSLTGEDIVVSAGDEYTKVKIDLRVTVHMVPARRDMPFQEKRDVWYVQSDFENIKSCNRMTVRIFRQRAEEHDREPHKDLDGHCIRGLEHKFKKCQRAKRNEIRTSAIYAVLREQGRRRREDLPEDPQMLAGLYREYSYGCCADATNTGYRDALATRDQSDTHDEPEPMEDAPQSSTRKGLHAFDDSDIRQLEDDLSSGGEVEGDILMPVHEMNPRNTASSDDDSFRAKAKREKRGNLSITRFFKKKTKKLLDKEKSASQSALSSSLETPVKQRRFYRRSSM